MLREVKRFNLNLKWITFHLMHRMNYFAVTEVWITWTKWSPTVGKALEIII